MKCKATISEFGLIGTDDAVHSANKFLSAKIDQDQYRELEAFAKTDSGKDVLNFAGNGKYLQAKSYVGTIQTRGGFTLEILPKTASNQDEKKSEQNQQESKQIFMKLLHILHRLPSYKNINQANFERIKNIDIFEIFIIMFLDEVGQIIKKGVKSDYNTREENLFYLKGKLRISEQIKYNSIHKERFYVEYDDYNQNRAENRLIKSTLNLLSKVSRDFQNIRRIRQYMEHMNWVDLSMNVDNDLRSIKLGRGMEHYKHALVWARVFLKKESFSSFSGDTIAFAILYPMEKLFEGFVEWYLKKYENEAVQVIAQSGEYNFVMNEKNKKLFVVRPDFLLKEGNDIVCVADAKWKLINEESDFSQGDFYQLFTYKHIVSKEAKEYDLRIYYPKTDYFQKERIFKYFGEIPIKVIPLDLKKELLCGN